MSVIKQADGLLTNCEVYELLLETRQQRGSKSIPSSLNNRENVETHTLNYLKNFPGSTIGSDKIQECIRQIKALNLFITEAELIQIANLLPKSVVEIFTVRTFQSSLTYIALILIYFSFGRLSKSAMSG